MSAPPTQRLKLTPRSSIRRTVAALTVAGAGLVTLCLTTASPLRAQSPQIAKQPDWRLPSEAAGVEGIVRALISVFDQADIVALGEAHDRKVDSDLRIALVRDPEFAKKVRVIVVEFGSTTEQGTLDRYVRGDNVSAAQLAQVWKTTTQAANGVWDDPEYAAFFAAVRDVNARLPADGRIRVFGGDPGPATRVLATVPRSPSCGIRFLKGMARPWWSTAPRTSTGPKSTKSCVASVVESHEPWTPNIPVERSR